MKYSWGKEACSSDMHYWLRAGQLIESCSAALMLMYLASYASK